MDPRTTDTPTTRRLVVVGGGAALLAGALAACSDIAAPQAGPASEAPSPSPSATPSPTPTTDRRDEFTTVVARSAVDALAVHDEPADPDRSAAGERRLVLDKADEISGEVVLLVLDEHREWLRVQLPVRPNGSTGWVRAGDVRLSRHRFAVEVSLGDHELVITRGSREVLRTPVGVGRSERPTPGGDYYIKELLAPPQPDGIYGPYAYGLSGFSTVLTEFRDGEGVIGIHGTNEPDLVGTDVSSGCIRVPNEVITRIVEEVGLPLGTPVTIRA